MSQRQSSGLESAAIRWHDLPQGAAGGAATRELGNPPAGLGEPPPAADISCDMRA